MLKKMAVIAAVLIFPGWVVFAAGDDIDGPCVDVEIGGDHAPSLKCLNRRLQQEVEHIHPTQNVAPLDAVSSAVKLGGYNQTALSQQYGLNYGKSVYPFRPTSVYSNPLSGKP